jgi:hypothetical protein
VNVSVQFFMTENHSSVLLNCFLRASRAVGEWCQCGAVLDARTSLLAFICNIIPSVFTHALLDQLRTASLEKLFFSNVRDVVSE